MGPRLIFLALCCVASVLAQRSETATLVLTVPPESRLTPAQVTLNFVVSADGSSDVTSQTQTVVAWVRALPGQPIRVTAGASGTVPLSALQWSGSAAGATGGGQQATCANGSFAGGATQDLVSSWTRSGTISCAISFSLAAPRSLPPGDYTAVIRLAIR